VVEQEGEVVSATNVVDADADSDTELSPRMRRIRVVCSWLNSGVFALFPDLLARMDFPSY